MCQTTDSAAVKIRVAKDLTPPHVACKNHNLNLEGQTMDRRDESLSTITEEITKVSRKKRGSM